MGGEFEKTDSGMKPAEGVLIPHKKNTGMAVALVLLVVIVLGLSGFILVDKLVWNKDQDKTSNNSNSQTVSNVDELEEKDKTEPTNKLECDEGDTPVRDGSGCASLDNIEDYIVVAEWNLKIKRPKGYAIQYRVEPDTGSAVRGSISFAGQDANSNGNWMNLGDFSTGGSLMSISRSASSESPWTASPPTYVGEVDGFHYWISRPAAVSNTCMENNDVCAMETEVTRAFSEVFSKIENYSSIK